MKGTSTFVHLGPKLEINLHGAPYELVPGYFINSLLVHMTDVISEGAREHVQLRNLVRVLLLTNIKFEEDEQLLCKVLI